MKGRDVLPSLASPVHGGVIPDFRDVTPGPAPRAERDGPELKRLGFQVPMEGPPPSVTGRSPWIAPRRHRPPTECEE